MQRIGSLFHHHPLLLHTKGREVNQKKSEKNQYPTRAEQNRTEQNRTEHEKKREGDRVKREAAEDLICLCLAACVASGFFLHPYSSLIHAWWCLQLQLVSQHKQSNHHTITSNISSKN
jgi:uncharacterized Rmd1/YagE family protein